MRKLVGKYAFSFDWLIHRLHIKFRSICYAADITVGWGPDCSDWEERKTRFLTWFYKWYWGDRCTVCWGKGSFDWIDLRQKDGSYKRIEHVTCSECSGTGKSDISVNG